MFFSVTQALVDGLLTTFQIFIFTLLFSLPLGLILAFGAMSRWKVLRGLIQTLVWIIRGTPLMLQLIIIFYGPGLWRPRSAWRHGGGFQHQLCLLFFRDIPGRYRGRSRGAAGGGRSAGHDEMADLF